MLFQPPIKIQAPGLRQASNNLYFEVLEIQPMRVTLSFKPSKRVNVDETYVNKDHMLPFTNLTLAGSFSEVLWLQS